MTYFEPFVNWGHRDIDVELDFTCECGADLRMKLEADRVARCPDCKRVWAISLREIKRKPAHKSGVPGEN